MGLLSTLLVFTGFGMGFFAGLVIGYFLFIYFRRNDVKAICRTTKNIAKPIIAAQILKYKIESVEFEALTLGSLSPTFQSRKAFGLKATIQVVDLQIFAAPRIALKPLVPSFPCFAKIYVCLMEKPHVDFGLKVLGADLMSIPGLYRFVQEVIKD
ncbi:hypothetical protein F0562_028470 [Nyssa sinensis]|uniref:SMP-LTD domain-containing protein n=1 Tax=Nyssa sinensis TaxID=561372 RepID=A0A5J5B2D4_9ASTE|nr:hypothetical protein F0562_028470 [Nyssa sinensis]